MTTSPLRRHAAALLVAAAGALLTLLVTALPAAAHAVLLGTDPADGDVVPNSPTRVVLTFNEPVTAVPDSTSILDADGHPQPVEVKAVDASLQLMPGGTLADGTYIVTWRVISADSHPVSGAFTFSVGAPSPQSVALPEQSAPGGVTFARTALQGLGYLGVLTVAGVVLFELAFLAATPGGMPLTRLRLRRVVTLGAGLAIGATWLAVPVTALWQQGSGWAGLTSAELWRGDLLSEPAVAAGLTTVGVLVAARFSSMTAALRPRSWQRALTLAGITLAGASLLVTGHTRTFGPSWLVLAADATHVLAGTVWLGGIIGLVTVLRRDSDASARRAATTLSRFSAAAVWTVAAVAAAGITLGWRILGSFDALLGTAYGQVLLIKSGVVLVVVAFAAYNRFRLLPATVATPDRGIPAALRTTVRAEGALLAAVVLLTGLLTGQSPVLEPGGPGSGAGPVAGSAGGSRDDATDGSGALGGSAAYVETEPLGSGTLTARLTPAARGPNVLELTLLDAERGPLEPLEPPRVSLTLTREDGSIGPLTHAVSATGAGQYQSNVDFPLDGPWVVEIAVRTSKFEEPIVTFSVEIP